jgi:hypothetical protein
MSSFIKVGSKRIAQFHALVAKPVVRQTSAQQSASPAALSFAFALVQRVQRVARHPGSGHPAAPEKALQANRHGECHAA